MEPVLTPEAMAAADRRTIDAGTPVALLMERAGRAVAWEVRAALGGTYGARGVVLCGKGNNGGDGVVAARALARWGVRTDVVELAGGIDGRALARRLARADVAVDALFGTGLARHLEGDAATAVAALRAWGGLTVAVDIPSGIDGLTGAVRGTAVVADRTVTFAARKPGLLFEPGRSHAGLVRVADIGVDLGPDGGASPPMAVLDAVDVAALLPARAPGAHKWSAALLVIGGSGGMTGAPLFASHAAMRAGAGIVWCALPGAAAARGAGGSEVVARALPDDDGVLAAESASEVLTWVRRFGALALGPGLGTAPGTVNAVIDILRGAPVPVVLDADGLNALGGDLGVLRDRGGAGRATVVSPHEGEYARLAGRRVGEDHIAAARELATAAATVVLLKGPGTVVAAPDGRVTVNPTGSEALASAGTGDVLTGVVGAFLARGLEPFAAASAAAWVHGAAADRARETTGSSGMVANDLVGAIAPTLSALDDNGVTGG
jgi:NAD(P)H-hydrate epimerase